MTIESSLTEHQRTGKFYRVDVYRYPTKMQKSALGRIKLRLAYLFPAILAEKVDEGALLSLDIREAQEKLPGTVYANGRFDMDFGYFGKIVEDKTLE